VTKTKTDNEDERETESVYTLVFIAALGASLLAFAYFKALEIDSRKEAKE
jgi:hypothetical protein